MNTMIHLKRNLFVAFLTLPISTFLPAQEPAPMPAPGGGMVVGGMPAPAPAATFVPGRMISIRPDEKRSLDLKESERNPYAKRNPQEELAAEENGNVEELRIRERLAQLRVTGRSHGPNGLRVLLGDIILEDGRIVPQLLEDQSESLRVVELNEDTVVLGWLDIETGELTGKTMQVAYDLTPTVGVALQGQPVVEGEEGLAMRRMGVIRVGQDRKKVESGMAARNPSSEIPPEVFEAGQ